ncbi:MAG: PAS domain S-box-containing protein [Desulforhopalus sp.]|jgi:PAS domain S-box-containing protein
MKYKRYQEGTEVQKQCTTNYQSIFDNATEPIIIWDEADHIILKVNPAASSYFGYSCEELEAMKINQLETEEDAQHLPERIKTLLEHGHIVYETVLPHKDRIIIQVAVSISRIVWDDRAAFCSIYHPLAERKQQDKGLLGESEARFRAITDSTKDAIIMMDENGLISLWNPAAERIFGYAGPEIIGRNLHTILAPSRYHQEQATAFRKFQQTGEGNAINNTLELKACHRDGLELSIELSLSKLHVLGAWQTIGIIRDITKRKKAEEELRESEERFRALHDASFGGIVIHDQGVIIDCNQGISEISGYTRDELIGMDGFQLIAPDWRSRVIEKVRSGFGTTYDAEGLRKDGRTYPLSIRGSNIPYKGRVVRVTEFLDITERKQLEDKLIQSQKNGGHRHPGWWDCQ